MKLADRTTLVLQSTYVNHGGRHDEFDYRSIVEFFRILVVED